MHGTVAQECKFVLWLGVAFVIGEFYNCFLYWLYTASRRVLRVCAGIWSQTYGHNSACSRVHGCRAQVPDAVPTRCDSRRYAIVAGAALAVLQRSCDLPRAMHRRVLPGRPKRPLSRLNSLSRTGFRQSSWRAACGRNCNAGV
jgi:hypothetical protein